MANLIEIDDEDILAALRRLQNHGNNLRPVLQKIGDNLTDSTKQRFASKTAPDGHAWLRNAESTQWARKKLPGGGYSIKGRDDPLIDGGTLGDTITSQLFGHDGVQIGSIRDQAAMMQFGGTKSEFHQLWGDIPARPYLGVSEDDKNNILMLIEHFLSS